VPKLVAPFVSGPPALKFDGGGETANAAAPSYLAKVVPVPYRSRPTSLGEFFPTVSRSLLRSGVFSQSSSPRLSGENEKINKIERTRVRSPPRGNLFKKNYAIPTDISENCVVQHVMSYDMTPKN
jgi:hypothetical protein